MTEPILAVRNVSKLFGSVIALSNVSAEVYPGQVTCLLGDNGAGKSTLIKIFAGWITTPLIAALAAFSVVKVIG